MQPRPYKSNIGKILCDPTGWWWSEKLDGIKGRWIDGKLLTRSSKDLNPPKWFRTLLPNDVNVEGELYFGKNTFYKTASLRAENGVKSWDNVEFHIFDIVDYKLNWAQRQLKLLRLSKNWDSHCKLVDWQEVKSIAHLDDEFNKIVENGGEGVIIADPYGKYEDGHVTQILKYKASKDCEAVIIGYNTDETGKRLSSVIVHPLDDSKTPKNITFNIGTGFKMKQRYDFEKRFPIGTIISYSYEVEGKNGKPRTPIYKGIRIDV